MRNMNLDTCFTVSTLLRATTFAAEKHRSQKRKDVLGTPYINHPIAVVSLMAEVGEVRHDKDLVAAMLHDTVEDTDATPEEIERHFGKYVRDLVMEVTDDKKLSKAERKRLQIEHAPYLTPAAKVIKLADKTANVTDLIASPPVGWERQRRLDYVDWANKVVDRCGLSEHPLTREFKRRVVEARAAQSLR